MYNSSYEVHMNSINIPAEGYEDFLWSQPLICDL